MIESQFTTIEWVANTGPRKEKSADWYWTLGTIAFFLALAAIIAHNWLFGILILLAGGMIITRHVQKRYDLPCALTKQGVITGHERYLYSVIKSFAINLDSVNPSLVLKIKRPLDPIVHIPLPRDIDTEHIRAYLARHVNEKIYEHSLSDALAEFFDI